MAKQSHSALPHYRLRKEYEVIADKALTTPTNTEHLMALKEEIDKVVEKTLPELDTRIIEARHRYCNTYIYIVCGCVAVWLYIYIYIYICALSQGGVPAGAHECVPLGDEAERGHVPVDGEDAPHPAGAP